jgi:hypothetical protein
MTYQRSYQYSLSWIAPGTPSPLIAGPRTQQVSEKMRSSTLPYSWAIALSPQGRHSMSCKAGMVAATAPEELGGELRYKYCFERNQATEWREHGQALQPQRTYELEPLLQVTPRLGRPRHELTNTSPEPPSCQASAQRERFYYDEQSYHSRCDWTPVFGFLRRQARPVDNSIPQTSGGPACYKKEPARAWDVPGTLASILEGTTDQTVLEIRRSTPFPASYTPR